MFNLIFGEIFNMFKQLIRPILDLFKELFKTIFQKSQKECLKKSERN